MLSFRQVRNLGFGIIFFIILAISAGAFLSQEKTTLAIKYIVNKEQDKLSRWIDIANLISNAQDKFQRDIFNHSSLVNPSVISDLNILHAKLSQLENDYPKEGLKAKKIRAELKPFKDTVIAYGEAVTGRNVEGLSKEMELEALNTAQRAYNAVYSAAEQVRKTIGQKNGELIVDIDRSNMVLIIGVLLGVFSVIFIVVFLSKSLTAPLIRLSKAMDKVATGDLNYRVPLFLDKDIDGLAVSFNKMAQDLQVSENKKAVENMKYIENIFNSMNDMLMVVSLNKVIETVNFSICNMLGYEIKEFLGQPVEAVLGKELKFQEEIIDKLPIKNVEKFYILKNGEKLPVLFSASAMYNGGDNFNEVVFVAQDLRGIKEAEEALSNNYALQKIMNSVLKFSLQDVDIDKILEYCFGEMLLIPGVYGGSLFLAADKPDVLVLKVQHGLGEEAKNNCANVPLGKCICGQAALKDDFSLILPNKEKHEIKYTYMPSHGHLCFPIKTNKGLIGLINMYVKQGHIYNEQDILFFKMLQRALAEIINRKLSEKELKDAYNELSLTQSQLVQTAKMASIGQVAGGVAHEINNPLTGVLNNVQMIKMMMGTAQEFKLSEFTELLDIIEESALRCKKITESLLDFSHASVGTFQVISLNMIIDKVTGLINNELKLQNISIQKEQQENLPNVQGDPQLLQQIIVNLVSNAKWAIEKKFGKNNKGGTVVLKTQFDVESKSVKIYISDNGVGIPEDKISKIFEPFFTTKQVGVGTGLGLYIVSNIIRKHRGTIEIFSKVNEGATFKISLPAV